MLILLKIFWKRLSEIQTWIFLENVFEVLLQSWVLKKYYLRSFPFFFGFGIIKRCVTNLKFLETYIWEPAEIQAWFLWRTFLRNSIARNVNFIENILQRTIRDGNWKFIRGPAGLQMPVFKKTYLKSFTGHFFN